MTESTSTSARLRAVLEELAAIGEGDAGDGSVRDEYWIAGWEGAVDAVEELLVRAGLLVDPDSVVELRVVGGGAGSAPRRGAVDWSTRS